MKYGLHDVMTYRHPMVGQKRKGRIFFLHGYGDYAGRYGYWFKYFAEHGYEVVSVDYPRFGKSSGEPKWVWGSPYDGVNACVSFIKRVNEKYGREKSFLMGYSLGGLQSIHIGHVLPELVDGLVLMAPFIDHHDKNKKFRNVKNTVDFFSSFLPNYTLVSNRDRMFIAQQHFQDDELKNTDITFNMLSNLMKLQEALPPANHVRLPPTLLMTAAKDGLIDTFGAWKYVTAAKQTDVSIVDYAQMNHMVYHDIRFLKQQTDLINSWMDARL